MNDYVKIVLNSANNISGFDGECTIVGIRVEFGDEKGIGVGGDIFVYLNTVFGSQLFAVANPVDCRLWNSIYYDLNGYRLDFLEGLKRFRNSNKHWALF